MRSPARARGTAGGTVAFRTIGCKLNQCETAQMQEGLVAAGYRLVDWDDDADVRVVNTCSVTARSDRTCRHEIHMARRRDPGCTLVVTGCYAQVAPEVVASIPGVDLVLGNLDKARLVAALQALQDGAGTQDPRTASGSEQKEPAASPAGGPGGAAAGAAASATAGPAAGTTAGATGRPAVAVTDYDPGLSFESEPFAHFHGYTRAFLKIQNGCDSRCAYCIIPLARGPARSMRAEAVVSQVRLLAERGFREIVLTGIDLGSWGRDTGEGTLADLLRSLLDQTEIDRPGRFRLSSIEPLGLDGALMDVVEQAGDRVARHFHLPLQSGSDSVLRRMDRPYSAAQYLQVVEELARRFPDAAIGADLIAGFPGETETEAAETLAFIEDAPLTYLHVFSYSDRPGTRAAAMRPKCPPEVIHERSLALRTLGERKREAFRRRSAGTEQRVLVLNKRTAGGRLVGLTGNYMEVLLDEDDAAMNRFVRVRLERPGPDGCWEAVRLGLEDPD